MKQQDKNWHTREARFKKNNGFVPKSEHYIYFPQKGPEADFDEVTKDWVFETIFEPMIHQAIITPEERVDELWVKYQEQLIDDDFDKRDIERKDAKESTDEEDKFDPAAKPKPGQKEVTAEERVRKTAFNKAIKKDKRLKGLK